MSDQGKLFDVVVTYRLPHEIPKDAYFVGDEDTCIAAAQKFISDLRATLPCGCGPMRNVEMLRRSTLAPDEIDRIESTIKDAIHDAPFTDYEGVVHYPPNTLSARK